MNRGKVRRQPVSHRLHGANESHLGRTRDGCNPVGDTTGQLGDRIRGEERSQEGFLAIRERDPGRSLRDEPHGSKHGIELIQRVPPFRAEDEIAGTFGHSTDGAEAGQRATQDDAFPAHNGNIEATLIARQSGKEFVRGEAINHIPVRS